eukprot:COSAG02_NODE_10835_length_1848_cov_2.188107_2_plen_194_part_00
MPKRHALHAAARPWATSLKLHWLAAASWLGAVSSQASPAAGAIPYSKCIGCEQAALLPVHFVSKQFYCHPDGSLADTSCTGAHGSPAACCAACLKVNAEKQMCDAWFMNEQGGCFFKNCPPSAWKSGECHVDPKPATVSKRSRGLARATAPVSQSLRHVQGQAVAANSRAISALWRDQQTYFALVFWPTAWRV